MNCCTKEELIAFERRIADLWEAGELPYLLHLSGGNEEQLIDIFQEEVRPGDWVFSSHRNHYHALLSGMAPERLEALIREGNSMFVFEALAPDPENTPPNYACRVNFFSSSILAGTCGIAAGVALQLRMNGGLRNGRVSSELPHVWCFIGDGAEDEGHFYEAVRLVEAQLLPCTFIIEDNDRSVETTKFQRLGDNQLFGLDCNHLSVRRYYYTPTYPHAGSGCKQHIQFKKPEVQTSAGALL